MANHSFQRPRNSKYSILAWLAVLLALGVIMLGAYTRLSDAGLGCPDWPGCYGKLVVNLPLQPIVAKKAWTEMIHRYFAGALGITILGLAIWASFRRRHVLEHPLFVPWMLVVLVIFQVLLGMWTVTLKLLPLVVMGHLLGAMTIAALLWWLTLSTRRSTQLPIYHFHALRPWAFVGLCILLLQIFLGAWTSTNYAALACPHFPYCQGVLFPHLDWRSAFNFASPIGPDYEGGRLAMNARITIQMVHRYGAFITAAYLIPFSICLITIREYAQLRTLGWMISLLIATQFTLGILNVELTLPMWTAIAHNGVATLLLLSIVTVLYKIYAKRRERLL